MIENREEIVSMIKSCNIDTIRLVSTIIDKELFEELIEEIFCLSYWHGKRTYKDVEYLPKRSYPFEFKSKLGVISRIISDKDFMIFEDSDPVLLNLLICLYQN